MMNKHNLLLTLKSFSLALVSALIASCSTNPVDGKRDFNLISEQQEVGMGAQGHRSVLKQMKRYNNPALQSYVNSIGQALARKSHRNHIKYTFTIIDDASVNAFALPGGYIYITTGLMAYLNSEAELAGVLAHEIGHVTAKHSVKQQSAGAAASILLNVLAKKTTNTKPLNQISTALLKGYGRDHELEADRLGAEYLARIGYHPDNMIKVIAVLKSQEEYAKYRARQEGRVARTYHGVFASHPSNDLRLQKVVNAAKRFKSAGTRPDNRNDYLKRIHGMRFKIAKNRYGQIITGTVRTRGLTYAQLARKSVLNEQQIRLLNGAFPNGKLIQGSRVKIVQ